MAPQALEASTDELSGVPAKDDDPDLHLDRTLFEGRTGVEPWHGSGQLVRKEILECRRQERDEEEPHAAGPDIRITGSRDDDSQLRKHENLDDRVPPRCQERPSNREQIYEPVTGESQQAR